MTARTSGRDAGQIRRHQCQDWLGYDAFILRQVPWALALGVLGLAAVAIGDSETREGSKLLLAGVVLLAACFVYCVIAWYRMREPGANGVLLAPEGLVYRLSRKQEHLIPWDDVIAIEPADRSHLWALRRGPRIPEGAVAVVVTKDFYERHLHVEWVIMRGPYWHLYFVDQGEREQVVLHHDIMSITPERLRAEVIARWHAFSRHPNARAPLQPWPAPRYLLPAEVRAALARVTPTGRARWWAAGALAALMLPVIYHGDWLLVRFVEGVPPAGSLDYYVGDLLAKTGLPARRADGAMVTVGRGDVTSVATPRCVRHISRDPTATGWWPDYEADTWCTADLRLKSGGSAVGLFRLVVETHTWGFDPKRQHKTRTLVAQVPAIGEAEQRLCTMGHCGTTAAPDRRP